MEQQEEISLPFSQASPILTHFTTFLTITLHSLLYHRSLYPQTTFLTARAYNLPVHQSRHPGVCNWLNDAVAAVTGELQRAAVDKVVFAVHAKDTLKVLERWVFDVGRFPEWGNSDAFGVRRDGDVIDEEGVNWTDVGEALRGALRRVAYTAEKMPSLPEGCTFTLAIELRGKASKPIGPSQQWIPSPPNFQSPKGDTQKQPARSRAITTPIRSVQAGPLFFECYVEQAKPETSQDTQNTTLS